MKFIFTVLSLLIAFSFCTMAANDSLVIKFKDNHIEKIDVSQIAKIRFENITGVDNQEPSTGNISVKGNFPNPIQDRTTIEFDIATSGNVVIFIYDNSGNQIRILNCEGCQSGKNTIIWNCLDGNNNRVRSGSYFYEVHFGNELLTRKMIVIN